MISKSKIGQTKKYSGMVKNVQETSKKAQPAPEEERITPEQVINAFQSFGFQPNERGMNDLGYWTTRGQSEGPKLMEELRQRRMDIIKQEDEAEREQRTMAKQQQDYLKQQNESKVALPRLSDTELSSLFDEYGIPLTDPEAARNNLPNDPMKIRSILEVQRKTMDDMAKREAKNAVSSMPDMSKMAQPSTPMVNVAPRGLPNGMGGPMQAPQMPGITPDEPVTPFFIGDHAIVRISNPRNPNYTTTWLVDVKKKVLRPFMSEKAFRNAFDDPDEAERAVIDISSKDLGPGGALEGFTPLKGGQGVSDDGSMEDIPYTVGELQSRYGKPENPTAVNKAITILDGIFGKLKEKISPNESEQVPSESPTQTQEPLTSEPQVPEQTTQPELPPIQQ